MLDEIKILKTASNSPTEPNQNSENGKDHQNTMACISEIVSQNPELLVTDEHEEQNEANHRSDEEQQSEEQSLGGANAINSSRIGMGECYSATRKHNFQSMFEIFVLLFLVTANVSPHHVNDNSTDQRVFNDEGVKIWRWVLDDSSHDVDAFAACGVQVERWNSREVSECFSMGKDVELVIQALEFVVNVRSRVWSKVSNASNLLSDCRHKTIEHSWWRWCHDIFTGIVKWKWWHITHRSLSRCCGIENGILETVVTRVEWVESGLEEASAGCEDIISSSCWQSACGSWLSCCLSRWQSCSNSRKRTSSALDESVEQMTSRVFSGNSWWIEWAAWFSDPFRIWWS